MSPEIAEVQEWLVKAATDLAMAEKALAEPDPIPEGAVFHCQQAVEKAMKGFLTWRDMPFGKSHNLAELGARCAEFDPSLQETVSLAAPLTQFAWRYRYPGAPVGLSLAEARDVLAVARDIVGQVLACLPGDFRPPTR